MSIAQFPISPGRWRVSLYDDDGLLIARAVKRKPFLLRSSAEFANAVKSMMWEVI